MKNNLKKRMVFYVFLIFFVISLFIFQGRKEKIYTKTYTDYLDTVCDITIVSNTDKALSECEEYLKFAEQEFSAEDENSSLFAYNKNQNKIYSNELLDLIATGDKYTSLHPEYFSIYLGELIDIWNISRKPDSIPKDIEIQNAQKIKSINLGGIAKGYITDKLIEKLKENNIESALINLGGNTYAMGKKPTGENWKIGIQSPKDENIIIGSITAENLAVITSGDYQRYAEIGGVRYHHILDPKTGYPVNNGVRSVTVICENAELADFLSTAAFVAGVDEGNKLIKSYGALGLFITEDTVYFSKGLENIFRQMDFSYKYEFLY